MNQWNYLLEGLTKGLGSIGMGLIEKKQKDQAKEYFDKGMNFLNGQGLVYETAIKNAMDINNPPATEDVPQGLQNILANQKQTVTQPQSMEDFWTNIADLKSNKYGEPYAQTLEGIYKERNKAPEYKVVGDKMYEYKGGKWNEVLENKKESVFTQSSDKLPILEQKDGKYYVKYTMLDKEGNSKFSTPLELDENSYNAMNDLMQSKSISPEEKNQLALDLYGGKKSINLSFGTGTKGSKGRSGKEILSTLQTDQKSDLLKYAKDSDDFNKTNFANDEDRQKAYDRLKATRERLSQTIPISEIDKVKDDHIAGTLTIKDITKVVKRPDINISFNGKNYNIARTKGQTEMVNALRMALQNGQITPDKLQALFELNQNSLPPEFITFLQTELKRGR